MKVQKLILTAFLIIHHSVAMTHGGAHDALNIFLPPSQELFVNLVIVLLPIVAVVLVWTRFTLIGLVLFLFCMVGSLIFDVYHHYILISPDNIAHLPHGPADQHDRFIGTANALALLQIIGITLTAYMLGTHWHFQRSPNDGTTSDMK